MVEDGVFNQTCFTRKHIFVMKFTRYYFETEYIYLERKNFIKSNNNAAIYALYI